MLLWLVDIGSQAVTVGEMAALQHASLTGCVPGWLWCSCLAREPGWMPSSEKCTKEAQVKLQANPSCFVLVLLLVLGVHMYLVCACAGAGQ